MTFFRGRLEKEEEPRPGKPVAACHTEKEAAACLAMIMRKIAIPPSKMHKPF